MSITRKLFSLLPDFWEDVVIRAHQYEAKFNQFEKNLDNRILVFSSVLEGLLKKLNVDWASVLAFITNHKGFKKIANVPVDINAWIKLPDDFNGGDPEQVQELISTKIALLKETLSPVQFESLNLDLAIDQLEDILQTLANVPMNMDLDDPQSINEYKNTVLNEVKPKVMVLINTVFNINVAESSFGDWLEDAQSVSDAIATKMFTDQSEPISKPNNQGDEEGFEQEENAISSALNVLSKLRSVLLLIQAQLAGKSIAGVEADTIFRLFNDFLDVVEANLEPLVEQIAEVQWQDLSLEEGITQIKALLASVSAILEESKLGPLLNQLKTSLPIPSSPITWEGLTQEQAWTQFKSVISKPEQIKHWEDVSELRPVELLTLFNDKFNEAVALLKHANVFGQNLSQMLDRIIEPFEALTDIPVDHDYSDLKANGRLLLDKVLQLGELFIPDVFDDPIASPSQATDNQNANGSSVVNKNTDSVEVQANQTEEQKGNQSLASKVGLTPANMVRAALVLLKKCQLIYDFLKENKISLTLKEKQGSAVTGQTPITQTDEIISHSETNAEQSASSPSQPVNGAQHQSTVGSTADASMANSELNPINSKSDGIASDATVNTGDITNEDWLVAIMGDKERGLISQLDNETDQDFLINLLNGTLIESTVNTVMAWPEVQSIKSQTETKLMELLIELNLKQGDYGEHKQDAATVVPSLGSLVKFIVNGISVLYEELIDLATQLVSAVVKVFQYLTKLVFRLIRAATIPDEGIPDFIQGKIFSEYKYMDEFGEQASTDRSPNAFFLVVSIPIEILKNIIEIPLESLYVQLVEEG